MQPDFKCRGNAGSWRWWRRQQREQMIDTRSLAQKDKAGSEDWQEVWDLKCYWNQQGRGGWYQERNWKDGRQSETERWGEHMWDGKATEAVDGARNIRVVSRGSKLKKDWVQEDKKLRCRGSSTERGRTRTGCGRQAEKFRLGWGPGKNDLGCPVEKTGCVTMTMFRGTGYCCVNYLDFGTYRASSSWHITPFVV